MAGGGAAGYFAAIAAAEAGAKVVIYEKSRTVLGKVRVSGGGRCNVTQAAASQAALLAGYPRGRTLLKKLFRRFDHTDTIRWFEQRGVPLKTEPDGRVFPVSNRSQTIIGCLEQAALQAGVQVRTGQGLTGFRHHPDGTFSLFFPEEKTAPADALLLATGGFTPQPIFSGLAVEPPVPSLFTFNVPEKPLHGLMGLSVPAAEVRLQGSGQRQSGPLLITHWGLSGPAVLKLSAFAARELAEKQYQTHCLVAWSNAHSTEMLGFLQEEKARFPQRRLGSQPWAGLPQRLWAYLLERAGIVPTTRWADLPVKALNRLSEVLCNDVYPLCGKTTFKEEFVTCGGISLSGIDPQTLESRLVKGLYFAGEVLDVDGITGGYNFQAAWTTGYVAGQAAAEVKK